MSFGDFVRLLPQYWQTELTQTKRGADKNLSARLHFNNFACLYQVEVSYCLRLEKHTTVSNAIAAHEELLALLFMLFYSAIGRQTWWQQGGERR